MERLTYDALAARGCGGYLLGQAPERVLQFGEGNFLRAFAEDFIDRMNEAAGFDAKVVLVQPRGSSRRRSRSKTSFRLNRRGFPFGSSTTSRPTSSARCAF